MLDDGAGGQLKTTRILDVNVQIVNGFGDTDTTNGLGNRIVGYNENNNPFFVETRTWFHNVVTGQRNSYTSYVGLFQGQ